MDAQPRTFEQMALRPTRYEVELTVGSKRRIIGYTPRKTRDALLRYVQHYREEIVQHIGDPDSAYFTARRERIDINDDVSIGFTGRTERDARAAIERGEQPEVVS